MASVTKVFRAIPLHINPDSAENETTNTPWLCDLSLLSSTADPTSIFAMGLDDPEMDRFLFCTALCVSVKETFGADFGPPTVPDVFTLNHQRPYAMLRRQQNSSIGAFLHGLSQVISQDTRLKGVMVTDDDDDEEDSPSDTSVLTLELHFDIDAILTPVALKAGIIMGNEVIEHIDLRFEFSRTARAAHVASLAIMMAAHSRLGSDSLLGQVLGVDVLHVICNAYRLRLYECRKHVWSE